MAIRNSIQALSEEITGYRRAMHENPQTAFEETYASDLVARCLSEWGVPFERGIATTGIVATIEGSRTDSGKVIGLRADMDALNMIEDNSSKPWHSKTPGKMHGCGHDGHTALLLGAAKYLSENRAFNGKVHLIFQPAEEGGRGAQAMIDDGLFTRFPCDQIFGLHNWPSMPAGTIGLKTGPIMAASDTFTLTIHGKGGHAAYPHRTIDPVVIGSQIVMALQTLISRTANPIQPAVLSVTNFNAGTGAHNVIANTAQLIGTVRTYDQELRKELSRKIGEVAAQVAAALGGRTEYNYRFIIDPTINEEQATALCTRVARKVVGDAKVDTSIAPSMGGEDFGAMLLACPGAYIRLGQGDPDNAESNYSQGLHTSRFDFNDEVIPVGIEYWVSLVEEALPLG